MKDEQHKLQHLSARVKEELPNFIEEQFGHLEQEPPKSPSFLLVVLLFAATIIVIFVLAIIVLHFTGGSLGHYFRPHPTS